MSTYGYIQKALPRKVSVLSRQFKTFQIPYVNVIEEIMPRKRRKRIAAESAPEIPYPRVRVEWIDCVSDSGWATDKEFDKMSLAKPVNEGWLYSKDKKSIKLFASYDKDDDGITFGDRTMIPRQWVKKIQKLQMESHLKEVRSRLRFVSFLILILVLTCLLVSQFLLFFCLCIALLLCPCLLQRLQLMRKNLFIEPYL